MTIKYSETELDNMIRYSELYGKMIPGEQVTEMLESLQSHLETKLDEMKDEYESDNDSFLEHHTQKIDEYHSELSDRMVDIKENIKVLLDKIENTDNSSNYSDIVSQIVNELDRLEIELFYELD